MKQYKNGWKGLFTKKNDKYPKIKNRKIGNIDLHMHAHTRLEVLREEKKGKLGSIFDPSVETELNQQSSMQVCIHSWV